MYPSTGTMGVSYEYDKASRVTGIKNQTSATTTETYSYLYDTASNITKFSNSEYSGHDNTYQYDNLNQLTGATYYIYNRSTYQTVESRYLYVSFSISISETQEMVQNYTWAVLLVGYGFCSQSGCRWVDIFWNITRFNYNYNLGSNYDFGVLYHIP